MCHKCTLELFIVVRALQASSNQLTGFSWDQRHANECMHQFCTFLYNFYVWECHLNSIICYFPLSTIWSCEPVWTSRDPCFALREIHISIKRINNATIISVFDFVFWWVLQFFRFPGNNIRQYLCMTLIKI